LPLNTVEKDYVLGWVLMGIQMHPEAQEKWIFKGGTCLKKCFFDNYRFSEDLDFTILAQDHMKEDVLKKILKDVSEWVYEESGIELPEKYISVDLYKNPHGAFSVEGKLTYFGPLKQKTNFPRIKLDLTAHERVVLPPEKRSIFHNYSDKPANAPYALSYCYEEIFAEKLRALAERARPRDLYDVIHLYEDRHRLSDKSKPYSYGKHLVPHDAAVHEYSTGLSRVEVARNHGIHFTVVPGIGLNEGIDAVRNILNRCWFDEVKCSKGITALESYKKEWNDRYGCWSSLPLHNFASHGADAFRMLVVGLNKLTNNGLSAEEWKQIRTKYIGNS
jgi:predicted nucleotidyltransferase component of viral defense system